MLNLKLNKNDEEIRILKSKVDDLEIKNKILEDRNKTRETFNNESTSELTKNNRILASIANLQQNSQGSLNNTLVYNINSQQCISQNDTGNHNSLSNLQNSSKSILLHQQYEKFSHRAASSGICNNSLSRSWSANVPQEEITSIMHSTNKRQLGEEYSISSTKQNSKTAFKSSKPHKANMLSNKKLNYNFSYALKSGAGSFTSRVTPTNSSSPNIINLNKQTPSFDYIKMSNLTNPKNLQYKKTRSHSFNSNLFNSPGLTKNKSMPYLSSHFQKITLSNNSPNIRTSNNPMISIKSLNLNLTSLNYSNSIKNNTNAKSMKYSNGPKSSSAVALNSNKGTIVNDKNYEEETLVINNINQPSKMNFNKQKIKYVNYK